MLLVRESVWWIVATSLLGLMLGYTKGIPRWGFLLGLFLGPIGCGIVVMLPSQKRFRSAGAQSYEAPRATATGTGRGTTTQGPTCARCGQLVDEAGTVCRSCGNILIPVSYKVLD